MSTSLRRGRGARRGGTPHDVVPDAPGILRVRRLAGTHLVVSPSGCRTSAPRCSKRSQFAYDRHAARGWRRDRAVDAGGASGGWLGGLGGLAECVRFLRGGGVGGAGRVRR